MGFFKEVEGEAAVLNDSGVYKQVPLYTRDGYIYAKIGGGFVRLMADGSTTKSKLRLDYMTWDGPICKDTFGRLCAPDVKGAKQLQGDAMTKLLGAPQ